MDWNTPTKDTAYLTLLDNLKTRDFDALSMGKNTITNVPQYAMRFNRSTNIFEEYDSGWNAKVLAVAGGGTGATSTAGLKASLGFGTMADQNANSVAITGGSITGIATFSISGKVVTSSNLTDSISTAGGITCAGNAIINTSGKIPAISSTYFTDLSGANITGVNASTLQGNAPAAFATAGHNHSGVYAALSHNHDGVYQPIGGGISINSDTSAAFTEGSNQDYPLVSGSTNTRIYRRTGLSNTTVYPLNSVDVSVDISWNEGHTHTATVTTNTGSLTLVLEHGLVAGT